MGSQRKGASYCGSKEKQARDATDLPAPVTLSIFFTDYATTVCMLNVPPPSFDSKNLVHPALECSSVGGQQKYGAFFFFFKKSQSEDLLKIKQNVELLSNDMKAHTSEDPFLLCNF